MIDLRSMVVAALFAAGAVAGVAQADAPLANIDRELNTLCARLPNASSGEAATIRSRLAALWRERVALLASLPGERRIGAQQSSTASAQCLTLAKTEAAPRLAAPKNGAKATAPSPSTSTTVRHRRAFKNGGGAAPKYGGDPAPVTRGPASVDTQVLRKAIGPPAAANGTKHAEPEPMVRSAPAPGLQPHVLPPPVAGSAAPPPGVPLAPSTTPVGPAAAQLEEFFPWPPPAPSDRRLLQLAQLGGDAPAANWGQVADRIVALLQRARYPSWGFYAAPGGFAVIPRVEQLDDQSGMALAGDARWASEVRLASTSVLTGIFTVQRPQGLYRVIVFVLTTDPRSGGAITDPTRMLQIARSWSVSGAADLPQAMRAQPVDPAQRLFALDYEFEYAVGAETKVNSPGRWQIGRHFTDAGIVVLP